jgi:hypothetical protein
MISFLLELGARNRQVSPRILFSHSVADGEESPWRMLFRAGSLTPIAHIHPLPDHILFGHQHAQKVRARDARNGFGRATPAPLQIIAGRNSYPLLPPVRRTKRKPVSLVLTRT